MPSISVVIPFYNRLAWLEQAVDSVFSQTFDDYEIIIVNDGSEEDTSRLNDLSFKKVRLIEQPHRGRSAARNTGMRLAKGKYVAFLDADDLFMPSKLERQISIMENNPDVMLSHTSYRRIDTRGNFVDTVNSGLFTGHVYPRIVHGCPIATPTVMVRSEALSALSFEESVSVGEDIILWCSIAKRTPILGIQEPLTQVRMHREMAASDPHRFLAGNKTVIEYACRRDSNLSVLFRLKAHSCVYSLTARIFKEQGRFIAASRYLALSIVLCPTRFLAAMPQFCLMLIVLCTPKKYRPYLTRMRKVAVRSAKAVGSFFMLKHPKQ